MNSALDFDFSQPSQTDFDGLLNSLSGSIDSLNDLVTTALTDFGQAFNEAESLAMVPAPINFGGAEPVALDNLSGQAMGSISEGINQVFSFDIPSNNSSELVIASSSSDFDSVLSVFDENENLLFRNDDANFTEAESSNLAVGENLNSRVVADFAPGSYFAIVRPLQTDLEGDYQINFSPNTSGLEFTEPINLDAANS